MAAAHLPRSALAESEAKYPASTLAAHYRSRAHHHVDVHPVCAGIHDICDLQRARDLSWPCGVKALCEVRPACVPAFPGLQSLH